MTEALIVPASDAVFNVADPPADAKAWAGIERQAAMLAEGGARRGQRRGLRHVRELSRTYLPKA